MNIDEYLLSLEKNLMAGSARWIADFTESFRDYFIKDTEFSMVIKGSTRPKGFFLSRLVAYFSLPNYQVATLAYTKTIDREQLHSLIKLISDYMKEENIRWSWLVIAKDDSFSRRLKNSVEKMDIREIGVALVDTTSGEVNSSSSYIARRMTSHIRCSL